MKAAVKGKDKKGKDSVNYVQVERYRSGKELKEEDEIEDDFVDRIHNTTERSMDSDLKVDRRLERLSNTKIVNTEQNFVKSNKETAVVEDYQNVDLKTFKIEMEELPESLPIYLESKLQSEYEDSCEEREKEDQVMFIPKSLRDSSINAAENVQSNAIGRALLCEFVARHENFDHIQKSPSNSFVDPLQIDDKDPSDEDEKQVEYNKWKLRELLRFKRNKEEEEKWILLQHEMQEFRSLPDSEKERIWNERLSSTQGEEKSKYEFMQRYYHKGAFFQDSEDPILKRNYDLPVQSERIDRASLPQSMQVKNFGKRGQSKWTHLSAEDTTAFDSSWGDKKLSINYKMTSKMGGFEKKNK